MARRSGLRVELLLSLGIVMLTATALLDRNPRPTAEVRQGLIHCQMSPSNATTKGMTSQKYTQTNTGLMWRVLVFPSTRPSMTTRTKPRRPAAPSR